MSVKFQSQDMKLFSIIENHIRHPYLNHKVRMQVAQDRSVWRTLREAYAQQWKPLSLYDDHDDDDISTSRIPIEMQ